MRTLKKCAAIGLTAAMALTSAQLMVFADGTATTLPSAGLKELTGAELKATDVNGILGIFGYDSEQTTGIPVSDYTMNKAVIFSTNYETNEKGELTKAGKDAQDADLETYGDWICDFRINIDTPDDAISGDEIILIGNYGDWGNIGFVTSKIVEMRGDTQLDDGDHYLMQLMSEATGLPKMANETYREVVNLVGDFKCGIVDNDLPMESVVTVQLVMYEDRNRTIVHEIGNPVIYEKHAKPSEPETEVIPVGELDAEVQEVPAEGADGVEVTGIKDSMLATEKTKLINDYIVENNVEKPEEGTVTVDVDIFAKTEQLTPEATKFELTPYANITCGNNPSKEVEITNDQLKEDAAITVELPAQSSPLYIIHKSEGMPPEKYVPGDYTDTTGKYFTFDADKKVCRYIVTHFSTETMYYAQVAITDKDAYVDNDGLGNLRFITTYGDIEPVTEFGTWIVSDDIFSEGTGEKYINGDDNIEYGSTFTADLMRIPSDWVDHVFYAKSYVNIAGVDEWSAVESASVKDYKNYTSR